MLNNHEPIYHFHKAIQDAYTATHVWLSNQKGVPPKSCTT